MYSRIAKTVHHATKLKMAAASHSRSTFAPLSNQFYLFNYFEAPEDVQTFRSVWKTGSDYVKTLDGFVATYLHHSTDPNTKFPWVNFAVAKSLELPFFGKKDEWWMNYMQTVMKHGWKANPAGFHEIASYSAKDLLYEDKERSSSTRFFITAIKASEGVSSDDIEINWKDWTGTELLHQQLNKCADVVDSNLYKSFPTRIPTYFSYTVRTEVNNMDENTGNEIARSINKRTTIPKEIETFTGFYQVAIPIKKA